MKGNKGSDISLKEGYTGSKMWGMNRENLFSLNMLVITVKARSTVRV